MAINTPADKNEEVVYKTDPPTDSPPLTREEDGEAIEQAIDNILGKNPSVLRIGGLRKKC
jgi:hypothetical protein